MTHPAAFEGSWTISDALAQQAALREALDAGASTLDLSRVHEIDSAGVQLLLAARRTAASHGLALTLSDASPAVRELLQRYGLLETLTAAGDRP